MAKRSIQDIEQEAVAEIKAIVNKPWWSFLLFWRKGNDERSLKFAIILAITKIVIPALIAILKTIDAEKFAKLIQYLEQAQELLASI